MGESYRLFIQEEKWIIMMELSRCSLKKRNGFLGVKYISVL